MPEVDRNWHKFSYDGVRFLFDVKSGSLHEIDDVAWDVLESLPAHERPDLVCEPGKKYGTGAAQSALTELDELFAEGSLTPWDAPDEPWTVPKEMFVKALCLHVAHACNLRCRYCFAGGGSGFGGSDGLMPGEIARRSVDFLIVASGPRRHCEIDFFGGEPLLNFECVKEVVAYAREVGKRANKEFRFTLTTNAVLLNDEVSRFLRDNGISVVLSLDGRREVNDEMRVFPGGGGTYEQVAANILRFIEIAGGLSYYVRGTFTRRNLDFAEDVLHLADLGVKFISVEPVIGTPDDDYSLRPQDLPKIEAEYERLARAYLKRYAEDRPFSFFHFNVDLEGGPCHAKRLSGCGAGVSYLAVTPDGSLYPCHQFVGRRSYVMGDVFHGIINHKLREAFRKANIYSKNGCSSCWARFHCSGGCHANAELLNGSIFLPDGMGCRLQRKRLECALVVKAFMPEISERRKHQ